MKNAIPTYYQTARAYEAVALRARECAVHGDMERDARILMADFATGTKLIARALFASEHASERAYPAMVEIARLLGVVGEDLNAYFVAAAQPDEPIYDPHADARSEREKEDV